MAYTSPVACQWLLVMAAWLLVRFVIGIIENFKIHEDMHYGTSGQHTSHRSS
ncbi:hypothetical protein MHBO_003806 [Bonamia ostreae]|uniref:ATP synthase F0 subunit 8 n=1 Tax=Bonamia ostreae TaxID=126728 RepID=A0ABV2ASE5_9EUKA